MRGRPDVQEEIATWGPAPSLSKLVELASELGFAFSQAELKKLYRDKKDYLRRVERSLDESTKHGWFLPMYRSAVMADAAAINF